MSISFFKNESKFREWLEKNHKIETELLVGFYKQASNKPSLTWSQSVDQALCFGWIDSVKRTIDNESYSIRFTPRKSNSIWSTINIKKVEKLIECGLMTLEGIRVFELRKVDRSGIYAHEKEKIELELNYKNQFKMNRLAWDFFNNQSHSYKKNMIHWIMNAKQEKTRQSRLEKTILISSNLKKLQ